MKSHIYVRGVCREFDVGESLQVGDIFLTDLYEYKITKRLWIRPTGNDPLMLTYEAEIVEILE